MIAPEKLADLLNEELTRKSCSFAEYITISAPYVPPGAGDLLSLVERIARRDREHAAALEEAIVSLGGIPQPGIYDEGVADTNYLNIVYLCGLLLRQQRSRLEQFARRLNDCAGHPEVRELLLRIMDDDRSDMRELEQVLERHSPRAVPSQPAADAGAEEAGATGSDSAGSKKGGFDLKVFLARRGAVKVRPGDQPAPPAATPQSPAASSGGAEPPAKSTPTESQDKKPFDMKAYLAARKARKKPDPEPPTASE